jgi:phospholipid transport system transporter-binding protein
MLVLPPELTHRQAPACLRMLAQVLKSHRGASVVVDAHALKVFDTSVLAVLLECRREALSVGKAFSVLGLPKALWGMAGLYGVDALIDSADTSAAMGHSSATAGTRNTVV